MKLIGIDTLNSNKFLNFYLAQYEDNKSNISNYYFASRNKTQDLACVLADRNSYIKPNAIEAFTYIDNEDERCVVMIREFRKPLNSYVYSFPAGLIEEGESPEIALCREVKEEIGGIIDTFNFCQNYPLAMCAGLTDESNMLAVVKLKRAEVSAQNLDENEVIDVVKFDPYSLAEKIKYNEIKLTASGYLGAILLLYKLGINLSYILEK